jgi:hypothetical protein
VIKKTPILTSLLLAFIFATGCAHYRKDCPEPKRLPDEWLECSDHRSDPAKHSSLSAGKLEKAPGFGFGFRNEPAEFRT